MWCLLLTFPNSSSWWTSHRETTHGSGYCGAWPGWAVSVSVLPLTRLHTGFIRLAQSPFSSPTWLDEKPNSTWSMTETTETLTANTPPLCESSKHSQSLGYDLVSQDIMLCLGFF